MSGIPQQTTPATFATNEHAPMRLVRMEPEPMDLVLQMKLDMLENNFFNRTDRVAVFAKWNKTCPAEPTSPLHDLLVAHLVGPGAPLVQAKLLPPGRHEVFSGPFRIGSYAPSLDGTTKWACIDIDGGSHSHPVADPSGTTVSIALDIFDAGLFPNIEKSFSGTGWHIWIFFDAPHPAEEVRSATLELIPRNIKLKGGEFADPLNSEGIEVFPKQSFIRPSGYGSQVFLPWYFKAQGPANEFHKLDDRGRLVPYQPKSLLLSSNKLVEKLAAKALGGMSFENLPPPKPYTGDNIWDKWEAKALPLLPLKVIYGKFLTGNQTSSTWLQCRDPRSETGDRRPSAGVATGFGEHPRGWFHSFIAGKGMSVFKFMETFDPSIGSYYEAQVRVGMLTGIPVPF
jgi:TOTE conflict system, Archaeo-Eukaryotic Primase domain